MSRWSSRPPTTPRILEELRANGGALSRDTHWRLAKKAFAHHGGLRSRHQRAPGTIEVDGDSAEPSAARRARHSRAARARPCATARIRTSRRRSTATGRAGIAGGRAAARQGAFLQQPGGSGRRLAVDPRVRRSPPRPSSSTPIPAAAPSRQRWPRATARRSRPIRFRPSAACSAFNRAVDDETAREIAKTFVEAIAAPDYSAGGAGASWRRRRICGCCRCAPRGRTSWW